MEEWRRGGGEEWRSGVGEEWRSGGGEEGTSTWPERDFMSSGCRLTHSWGRGVRRRVANKVSPPHLYECVMLLCHRVSILSLQPLVSADGRLPQQPGWREDVVLRVTESSVRCLVSSASCPVSCVRCPVSGVQCPVFSVQRI